MKQSECVLNACVEVCVDIIDNGKKKHKFIMHSLKKKKKEMTKNKMKGKKKCSKRMTSKKEKKKVK